MARTPSPGPPQRGEPPPQRPFSVHLRRAVSHCFVPGSEDFSVKSFSVTADAEKGKKKEKKKQNESSILGSSLRWAAACSSTEQTPPRRCWSSVRSVFSLPSLSLCAGHPPPPSSPLCIPSRYLPPYFQLFPPFFSSVYESKLHPLTCCVSLWHVFSCTNTSTSTADCSSSPQHH